MFTMTKIHRSTGHFGSLFLIIILPEEEKMKRRLMELVDWLAIGWGGYVVFATWGQFSLYWIKGEAPHSLETFLSLSAVFIPFVILRWLLLGSPKLWVYPLED